MELTKKEQELYNTKLNNYFFIEDLFDLNYSNDSYKTFSLKERQTMYEYLIDKKSYLEKEITLFKKNLNNLKNKIKKELDLENFDLDEIEISLLDNNKFDLNKKTTDNSLDRISYLMLSKQDLYIKFISFKKDIEKKIYHNLINIKFISDNLKEFKPIEIKNGFYLFEDLGTWLSVKDPLVTHFNSIFIGNKENLIPDLSYDSNLEQKIYKVFNGKGGRKGGLFSKEVLASCPEEALLKLNKWALENEDKSWSIFKITSNYDFLKIELENKEELIK